MKTVIDEFTFYNADNLEIMAQYPDKYFNLSIIDPPYGIGESGQTNKSRSKLAVAKDYGNKNWDNAPPPKEFFDELFRISKNQIIFGANHFISRIPFDSSCWIVWDKDNGANDFADCELAWTSFGTAVRKFKWRWKGMLQQNMKNKQVRLHPTKKPIELYSRILKNYAKENDKILDTHLGSNSISIAIDKANKLDDMNLSFVGIELDKEYFDTGLKRFEFAHRQQTLNF